MSLFRLSIIWVLCSFAKRAFVLFRYSCGRALFSSRMGHRKDFNPLPPLCAMRDVKGVAPLNQGLGIALCFFRFPFALLLLFELCKWKAKKSIVSEQRRSDTLWPLFKEAPPAGGGVLPDQMLCGGTQTPVTRNFRGTTVVMRVLACHPLCETCSECERFAFTCSSRQSIKGKDTPYFRSSNSICTARYFPFFNWLL